MADINKTYTSNTLYNDSTGVIAFAEQLKQELINWANYHHVTEELGPNYRPDTQNALNNLFLSVYERFLTFLNDADATEEAINTWKEIERFLADYTDEKTLAEIVAELNANIESRLTVPLESTTGSSTTSTMTQKAITETIDASKTFTTGEKVDNIGIDSEPTAGSDNLVKSGGVYGKISQLDQEQGEYIMSSIRHCDNMYNKMCTIKDITWQNKASDLQSGYYDETFTLSENDNYRNIVIPIKPGHCYDVAVLRYGIGKISLIYLGDGDKVLGYETTNITLRQVYFPLFCKKIVVQSYKGWTMFITEYFSHYNIHYNSEENLKRKCGSNLLDPKEKTNYNKIVVSDEYARGSLGYDSNYSGYWVYEIINYENKTSLCVSRKGTFSNSEKYCTFTKDGSILSAGDLSTSPIDVSGAYRILVVLAGDSLTDKHMANFGETALPYEPYKGWYDIEVSNVKNLRLDNRKSMRFETASMSSETSLVMTDFPKYLKNNHIVTFEGKITNFNTIWIGIEYSRFLKVDGEKVYMTNRNDGVYDSKNHGLTINTYLRVYYKRTLDKMEFVVATKGGCFQSSFNISSIDEFCGCPNVKTDDSTSFTDVVITATSDDFTKNVWVVGDSLVSVYDVRWTYHVLNWGYRNFLLQGWAGGTSSQLWDDFQKSIIFGCPKVLVWLTGTNDLNADYETMLDTIVDYCDANNIELILGKQPDPYGVSSNEKKSFTTKNAYMLTKGKRYVDFRRAVSSGVTGTVSGVTVDVWYGDDLNEETPSQGSYIGEDRVHPSVLGAEAEAIQAIIDIPELTQV